MKAAMVQALPMCRPKGIVDSSPNEIGYGLLPQNDEPGDTVEVRWKLMDASGKVVKALRFAIRVGECSSACQQAVKDPPVSGQFSASYSDFGIHATAAVLISVASR
jgi:hypothetical protein